MDKAMDSGDAFAAHLQEPSALSAQHLASALAEIGFADEVALLRAYAERGAHWESADKQLATSERCWVGPHPPPHPRAGDLWFDPAEVVSAVLVPRPGLDELDQYWRDRLTPFTAWLSVRPVADWQLEGATYVAASAGIEPPRNGAFAAAYAAFFGKSLATAEDWSALGDAFGTEPVQRLWGADHPTELGGYLHEGVLASIALDRVLAGATEETNDEAAVDEGEPLDMPFRTHVPTQIGLAPTDRTWSRLR